MLLVPTLGILMSQLYGKPVNVFDYYQLPELVKENRDKSFKLTEESYKVLRKFKKNQDIYKKKNKNGI